MKVLITSAAFVTAAIGVASVLATGQDATAQTETSSAIPIDGTALYQENCAICHGEAGDGRGILAAQFAPSPRNFTIGSFRFRSTEAGAPPAETDLLRTIRNGINGSYGRSMPAFDQLSEDDLRALARVVLDFAEFKDFGTPIETPRRPDARQPELGRQLYVDLGCAQCHGDSGGGDGILADTFVDSQNDPIRPANLQEGIFKGGNEPEDVWFRIHFGIEGTPMPSFGRNQSIAETWALVDYVFELSRIE